MMDKAKIVVLNDREYMFDNLRDIFENHKFVEDVDVTYFSNISEAMDYILHTEVDLIITDFQLTANQQICEWTKSNELDIPIIVITDIINVRELKRFNSNGVQAVFRRSPTTEVDFYNKIDELLTIHAKNNQEFH